MMYIVLFLALVVTYYFLQWLLYSLQVGSLADKFVFITGCDSGFGRQLAIRLDHIGFHVFAGCLTNDGAKFLSQASSNRLQTVPLDISKTESIVEAVNIVKEKIPREKGLWALVNNAGIGGPWTPSEVCTKQDYATVFEVNLFGLVETTRLCLPLIRKAQGRVVNMASAAGRIAFLAAPYTCSKFAVEAYSDVLRRESFRHGIKVSVLEPGVFRTAIIEVDRMIDVCKVALDKCSQEVKDFYGPGLLDRSRERFLGFNQNGSSDLSIVVDAYTHAVTARFPKKRYPVGRDCRVVFLPLTYLPDWFVDWFITLQVYKNGV